MKNFAPQKGAHPKVPGGDAEEAKSKVGVRGPAGGPGIRRLRPKTNFFCQNRKNRIIFEYEVPLENLPHTHAGYRA